MQMNVLRTKQVPHVGSRDDHGQPIAGGDDHNAADGLAVGRQVQEPSYADIVNTWTQITCRY